jgi:hypothetical protein
MMALGPAIRFLATRHHAIALAASIATHTNRHRMIMTRLLTRLTVTFRPCAHSANRRKRFIAYRHAHKGDEHVMEHDRESIEPVLVSANSHEIRTLSVAWKAIIGGCASSCT